MDPNNYSKVLEAVKTFDYLGVFDIEQHVRPDYVPIIFAHEGLEYKIEVPFDMLEICFSETTREVSEKVVTPAGTIAKLNNSSLHLETLTNGVRIRIGIHRRSMWCHVTTILGNRETTWSEIFHNFSFREPKAKKITFTYGVDEENLIFEGPGKGRINLSCYTDEGLPFLESWNVNSRQEADEIVENQSLIYNVFRSLLKYMI